MLRGLGPGRIVHYVDPAGKHCPAIVAEVCSDDGKINIVVFDCRDHIGSRSKYSITYHPDNQLDTWHWPEPV